MSDKTPDSIDQLRKAIDTLRALKFEWSETYPDGVYQGGSRWLALTDVAMAKEIAEDMERAVAIVRSKWSGRLSDALVLKASEY